MKRYLKFFIAECHRRRVFRVAALYVVGAWIVLQVADLAFESWGIPAHALRYVWIGAVLGFPAALVFGWRFDIIGGRIVHTPDSDSATDLHLRRADYLILGALAIVVIATVFGVGGRISSTWSVPPAAVVATDLDPMSIAVLPFADMSGDEETADYLAIGIQEDLLTRLSKIGSLKVISRTSVQQYRKTLKSIPQIGAELGVGKILEGSVQRLGSRLRVNVQLIDSVTDTHVWAETYERSLTADNVFDMQSEIVEATIRQLEAKLTPEETRRLTAMPTQSLAAYTAYLDGRQQSDVESVESLHRAIDKFQEAIGLDPDFALAYVGLADAYLTLGANFWGGLSIDESIVRAEPPLVRSLELDGSLGEAYATLGLLRQQQGDWPAAEQAYERAISLRPSYSRAFRLFGRLRWQQERREEAMQLFGKALLLDPYSASVNYQMARALDESGSFEEALARYLRVVDIEPDHAFAYVYIAAIQYLVYGRVDESMVWYRRAADNDALSPSLQAAQAIAYLELGDPESAKIWVDKGMALNPETFWPIWANALLNVYVGDDAAAQQDARNLLELYPRNWGGLTLLRNADIAAGRHEAARSRYARAFRELIEPEIPQVDSANYFVAVDLALVLLHLGEDSRAADLLDQSLDVIEELPRLGTEGYWITDVRIYALQQRQQRALDALQQAVDEGWRVFSWFYLEHDPNLDSIRNDPAFQRIYSMLKSDLAEQARRVEDLKASGDI